MLLIRLFHSMSVVHDADGFVLVQAAARSIDNGSSSVDSLVRISIPGTGCDVFLSWPFPIALCWGGLPLPAREIKCSLNNSSPSERFYRVNVDTDLGPGY